EPVAKGFSVTKTLPGKVDLGQEFEITINLKADSDYEYVQFEDFLPAGVEFTTDEPLIELVQEDENDYRYAYGHSEKRDDRLSMFFDNLQKGEWKISYKVRAETPGTFTALPAYASLMYNEEIFGRSAESAIFVSEDFRVSIPRIGVKENGFSFVVEEFNPLLKELATKVNVVVTDSNNLTIAERSFDSTIGKKGTLQVGSEVKGEFADGIYTVTVQAVSSEKTITSRKSFQIGKVELQEELSKESALNNEGLEFYDTQTKFGDDNSKIPKAVPSNGISKSDTMILDFKILGGGAVVLGLLVVVYLLFIRKGKTNPGQESLEESV
ncbi:MAG: hypothetical protein Q7K42_02450, partial [Candidatus Diapherotrites archaeon]|nr:hypothetical protein [Candidatus Diapherotrites archaeon]